MSRDHDAALSLDRLLRRRTAEEAITVPGGLVVRHAVYPDVRYVNAVLLDAPAPALTTAQVSDLGDRWLGDRNDRHVVLDDAETGERLAPELCAGGFDRQRISFMRFAADPAALPGDPRAREISDVQAGPLESVILTEEVPAADVRSGLVARLLGVQAARRAAAAAARRFGAGEKGTLQSMCTLFCEPDLGGRRVAMVDEVGTLLAHRQRGLARAVVSAAVAAAADWGAELILVPVDGDDWPQIIYAHLGFEPLGRQMAFTRRVAQSPGSG